MKQRGSPFIPKIAIVIEFEYTLATIASRTSTEEGSNSDEFSRQVGSEFQGLRYPK